MSCSGSIRGLCDRFLHRWSLFTTRHQQGLNDGFVQKSKELEGVEKVRLTQLQRQTGHFRQWIFEHDPTKQSNVGRGCHPFRSQRTQFHKSLRRHRKSRCRRKDPEHDLQGERTYRAAPPSKPPIFVLAANIFHLNSESQKQKRNLITFNHSSPEVRGCSTTLR